VGVSPPGRKAARGAAIALFGTAAAVHFLPNVGWLVAFLVGALLVATGPTVIAPILEVVPVRDRVGTALDTEGIVNDVTATILAVVIFEAIVASEASGGVGAVGPFAQKLGIGLLVGLVVAAAVDYGLRYVDLSPGNAPLNARLLVLAGALVSYGAAEAIPGGRESGIAAVATAGILLGNADLTCESEIEAFEGDLTLLVRALVLVALVSRNGERGCRAPTSCSNGGTVSPPSATGTTSARRCRSVTRRDGSDALMRA